MLSKQLGLDLWCEDEAGPFQTIPQPGPSWQPEGKAATQPHEYFRQGTAKVLTLFQPGTGQVRVHGVPSCTNQVLHGWLQQELTRIVEALPTLPPTTAGARHEWERWLQGLSKPLALPAALPPLRVLLVLDNLAGHKTPAFVLWLLVHGIMPLYTPLGGSWLNMAESMQRILKRRALDGQEPQSPEQIMAWLEAVAAHWNKEPTPFLWGGKRRRRRERQRERRHGQGGSGAYSRKPVRRRKPPSYGFARDK